MRRTWGIWLILLLLLGSMACQSNHIDPPPVEEPPEVVIPEKTSPSIPIPQTEEPEPILVPEEEEVVFSNESLEILVREWLGEEDKPLTYSQLEMVESLNGDQGTLTSLQDIELLTNLRTLDLSACYIEDYSPLSQLETLEELNLSNADFSDLTILSSLPQLHTLYLDGNNHLTDVFALGNCMTLRTLSLEQCSGLKLESLSGLVQITSLSLSYNEQIEDAQALSTLQGLETLQMGFGGLQNLDFVRDLTSLQTLWIPATSVTTLIPLQEAGTLTSLTLHTNTMLENLEGLEGLQDLKHLDISNMDLEDEDMDALAGLLALEELDISYNHIGSLGWVVHHPQLQELDASSNEIIDVSPLSTLPFLRVVSLYGNPIEPIAWLDESEGVEILR